MNLESSLSRKLTTAYNMYNYNVHNQWPVLICMNKLFLREQYVCDPTPTPLNQMGQVKRSDNTNVRVWEIVDRVI